MNVDSQITAITNRHVARILSQLEEANMPAVCTAAVKREFWFLADDIKQVVSQKQEDEDELVSKIHG
jgi:hypothetical protein